MFQSLRILLCGCALLFSTVIYSQTTAELFGTLGAVYGVYDVDDIGQETDRGYYFNGVQMRCGAIVLAYVEIEFGIPHYLKIEGDKVYELKTQCEFELLFDFGLEVGATVDEGLYEGYMVEEKFQYALLNGENRTALRLKDPDLYPPVTWINGVGVMGEGIFPIKNFYVTRRMTCLSVNEEKIIFNGDETRCAYYSCKDPKVNFSIEQDELKLTTSNISELADSYLWDFGDGNTSTEEQPIHEYAEGGCYTVSLTVTNDCYGEKTVSKQEQVCVSDVWQEVPLPSSIGNYLTLIAASDELTFMIDRPDLYYSNDEGNSWTISDFPEPDGGASYSIEAVKMFDENRGILAASIWNTTGPAEGLYYTDDGGASWKKSNTGIANFYHCAAIANGEGWATGADNVFMRTEDFGQTWSEIILPDSIQLERLWAFNPGMLMGYSKSSFNRNIVWSTDNGNTWNSRPNLHASFKFEFASEQVAYGYKYWNTGLYKTIDQGATWELIDTTLAPNSLIFHNEDIGWIAGNDKTVYYTVDGGESFSSGNCSRFGMFDMAPLGPRKALGISGISWYELKRFDPDGVTSCLNVDLDMDGFFEGEDCDDNNAAVNPDAQEIPYNGLDDDCDETTLDDDLDEDGFLAAEDCDDNNAGVNPEAIDIPNNGIDEDCDGFDMVVSTQDLSAISAQIYPNPTNGFLTIKMETENNVQLTIFNNQGQRLSEQEFQKNTELDLRELANGIYFISLQNQTGVWTQKIIKYN